jgi:hypothetical protein
MFSFETCHGQCYNPVGSLVATKHHADRFDSSQALGRILVKKWLAGLFSAF